MSLTKTYIMIIRMLIMMVLVQNLLENVYQYEHHRHNEHILQQMLEHIKFAVTATINIILNKNTTCSQYISQICAHAFAKYIAELAKVQRSSTTNFYLYGQLLYSIQWYLFQ